MSCPWKLKHPSHGDIPGGEKLGNFRGVKVPESTVIEGSNIDFEVLRSAGNILPAWRKHDN